jgi:hypothetical protein
VRVQIINDNMPMIFAGVGGMRKKIAVSAYIGLVPISPNTSPMDLMIPFTEFVLAGIRSVPVIRNKV